METQQEQKQLQSQAQKQIMVWGFGYEFLSVVDNLKKDPLINIALWIGPNKQCDFSRADFMNHDLIINQFSPERCPDEIYEKVYQNLFSYILMIERKNYYFRYYEYSLQDYLNYLHPLLNYFYHLLSARKVDTVVFENIIHYGEDAILYYLAKAMGLKTITLYPSFIGDCFFPVYNLEDIGYYRETPELSPYEDIEVTQTQSLETYLTFIKNLEYKFTLWDAIKDFFKGKHLAFYKWLKFQKYKKTLQENITKNPDLSKKFVYFPLHFQPEMSTYPLGGKYYDQAYALEVLSDLLPDDCYIYVKENPYQNEFFREDGFFQRIKNIPNLVITPTHMNTHKLIEHSVFTATITGTSGWESITTGKNTLVFGNAWYACLPGVFRYETNLHYEDILNYTIDPKMLKHAISAMFTKSAKGNVSKAFRDEENFDPETNGKQIAQSLIKLIHHDPYMPIDS